MASTTTTTVTTRTEASEFLETQIDSLSPQLPMDVIVTIFSKMSRSCLAAMAFTCKYYNALSRDSFVWASLFHEHFPCPLTTDIHSEQIDPLDAYKKEFVVHQNLMNAAYTQHQLGVQEDNRAVSIDITGDQYISIYQSNVILCGNIKSNEEAQEVPFKVPGANCCIAAGGKIITGFENGEIQIFGAAHESPQLQFVCEKTFTGHKERIRFIALDNDRLYSYSDDHTIKIWDATTGDCLATLGELKETFKCLAVKDGKIAAGYRNGEIKIWDIKDLDSVVTLSDANNKKSVVCLVMGDGMVYASHKESSIVAWNIEEKKSSVFAQGYDTVYHLLIAGDKLIAEDAEGKLLVWDLATKICSPIISLEEVVQNISAFAFAEGRLILGLEIGNLVVLDFNASEEAILQEISEKFSLSDRKEEEGTFFKAYVDQEDIQNRFLRISEKTRNIIYKQLYNRFIPITKNSIYSNDLGSTFWFYCTGKKRAVAINDYLKALSRDKLPLLESNPQGNFLSDLGIITFGNFGYFLHCDSNFLSQVGILSAQDLDILGVRSRPVARLNLPSESVVLLQDCLALKIYILAVLKGMGTGLHERAKDNMRNSMPESEIHWESFLKKMDDLYAQIETQSETQEGLFSLFKLGSYSELISKTNVLIDQFNSLDLKHLREKLCAYVSQENIESVWKNFHVKGIDSLTKLVFNSDEEITEEYLFEMNKFNKK